MSGQRAEYKATLRGVATLVAVLSAAVMAALVWGEGAPSWGKAVAFAASICLAGSLGGWLVARWPQRTPALAVAAGLAGVALRIALPLAALAWLQTAGTGLRDAGADRLLLVFYLLLLATDIVLHIMEAARKPGNRRDNAAN